MYKDSQKLTVIIEEQASHEQDLQDSNDDEHDISINNEKVNFR